MPRGGRTTAFMALLAVLLLVPVATVDKTAAKKIEPKAPQYRPWRIYEVPDGGALVFDCTSDVPTLRLIPTSGSAEHAGNGGFGDNMPLSTCGGPQAGTPTQHKYGRLGKLDTGFSALYWAAPSSGEDGQGLVPAPKRQRIAICKLVEAVMDVLWKEDKGERMPESVPSPLTQSCSTMESGFWSWGART